MFKPTQKQRKMIVKSINKINKKIDTMIDNNKTKTAKYKELIRIHAILINELKLA